MQATARDGAGVILPGAQFSWSSSDPLVATVGTTGVVVAIGPGTTVIMAKTGEMSASATVTVHQDPVSLRFFTQPTSLIVAGEVLGPVRVEILDRRGNRVAGPTSPVTLSLPPPGINHGQLTGTTTAPTTLGVAEFTSVSINHAGQGYQLIATTDSLVSVSSVTDVAIHFVRLIKGSYGFCAEEAQGATWCWGVNQFGQLGTGDSVTAPIPVRAPVATAHTMISMGDGLSCGITSSGATGCWGQPWGSVPVTIPVTRLARVSAGNHHACGLTPTGQGWCWGYNLSGELGNGTTTTAANLMTATPVFGGHTFVELEVGNDDGCGRRGDGVILCWGSNLVGQLGNGSSISTLIPTPLATTIRFVRLIRGAGFGCGIDAGGKAYCWGYNLYGQLGAGSLTPIVNFPVAVAGNLRFATLNLGYTHACGLDDSGQAFCWGNNLAGELGIGSVGGMVSVPTPVQTTVRFSDIEPGGEMTCGITARGLIYCWGATVQANGRVGDGSSFAGSPVLLPTTIP